MPPALRRRDVLRGTAAAILGTTAASGAVRATDAPGLRWQRHVDRDGDEAFYDAARGPDGTAVLAGHAGSNTRAGLPIEDRRPLVVALDADGAARWEHAPDDATAAPTQTVLATIDGGSLVAGLDAPLTKFDADGAVAWTVPAGDPPIRFPARLAEFAPGTYAVAWEVPTPSGSYLHLAAVESGERRWSREWGLHHELGAVLPVEGRPAVTLVGFRSVDGSTDGSWLATVTADDAVARTATFDGPWQHAIRGPDGGLVVGGTRATDGTRRASIARLDPSWKRAWRRTYDGSLPDYGVRGLTRFPDGGYALLGSGVIPGARGPHGVAHLLGTDGEGERTWGAVYASRERSLRPRVLLAPSSGRFIVAGASSPYPGTGFDGWVAVLDPSASRTLTTTSPTPTDTGTRTPVETGTDTAAGSATPIEGKAVDDATTASPAETPTPTSVTIPGFGVLAGATGVAGTALLAWLRSRGK